MCRHLMQSRPRARAAQGLASGAGEKATSHGLDESGGHCPAAPRKEHLEQLNREPHGLEGRAPGQVWSQLGL